MGSYRKVLLLSGLLAGGVFFCSGADRYVERPASQHFRDPHTGRVLPPALGLFRKKEARISRNPVLGSMVLYVPERSPECTASIYLYALSEKPAKITEKLYREHLESVRRTLLEKLLENKRITGMRFIPDPLSADRQKLTRAGRFTYALSGRKTSTGIYMMPCGRFTVKVLLTCPEGNTAMEKEIPDFIREVGKLFIPVNPKRKQHKVPSNGK